MRYVGPYFHLLMVSTRPCAGKRLIQPTAHVPAQYIFLLGCFYNFFLTLNQSLLMSECLKMTPIFISVYLGIDGWVEDSDLIYRGWRLYVPLHPIACNIHLNVINEMKSFAMRAFDFV